MRIVLMIMVAIGFLLASVEQDQIKEQEALQAEVGAGVTLRSDQQYEILSQALAKLKGKARSARSYNTNSNAFGDLLGEWQVSYTIGSSYYSRYLVLNQVQLDSSNGYVATGYHSDNYEGSSSTTSYKLLLCSYDADSSFSRSDYICVGNSILGSNYLRWFFINSMGELSLTGEYYIGSSTESASAYYYGYTYFLYGVKINASSSSSSSQASAVISNSNINETAIKNKSYTIGSGLSGFYHLYDSNKWLLYMPASNYIAVHKSGENDAEDITSIDPNDFSSVDYSDGTVNFGTYKGNIADGYSLTRKSYTVSETTSSGFYHEYENGKWFLYMPSIKYLLMHESGKPNESEGAKAYTGDDLPFNVTYTSNSITFGQVCTDPFGNPIDCGSSSSSDDPTNDMGDSDAPPSIGID